MNQSFFNYINNTQNLTEQLLRCESITPKDENCQQIIQKELTSFGFEFQTIESNGVTNLWAIKKGVNPTKTFAFAGHTDVVPVGKGWDTEPFIPTIKDGKLYARGAADMKASIAAFVTSCQTFITENPNHADNIALMITSDEEGMATDGTIKILEYLKENEIKLDYCLVGEPTSGEQFGDTIKNGRRGSLSGKLKVLGVQGHIAYPHLADNPIHKIGDFLQEWSQTTWDSGNDFFSPTSGQISNIHGGTGANNVIPNEVIIDFNFRFSTESTPKQLQEKVENMLNKHHLQYTIDWNLSGLPFLTPISALTEALKQAIQNVCPSQNPQLSTTGGTSDGRFIAQYCPQVIEFGPCNASIHKINEHIEVAHIPLLAQIYYHTLKNLLNQ